jgi:hypothetical protein
VDAGEDRAGSSDTATTSDRASAERQRLAERYAARKRELESETAVARRRSGQLSLAFGVGIAALAVASAFAKDDLALEALVVVAGLLLIGAFVAKRARLVQAQDEAQRWWQVSDAGEARCRDTWRKRPADGAEFIDATHPYSLDLDVFGPASLFQLANVAHTRHGQRALAALFSERVALSESRARQQAVRCLAGELELRQQLETLTWRPPPRQQPRMLRLFGRRAPAPARDATDALLEWAEAPPVLLPRVALRWAASLMPVCTVLAVAANLTLDVTSLAWKLLAVVHGVLIALTRPDTDTVFGVVSHWQGVFARLSRAFALLEGLTLDAPLLQGLRQAVVDERTRASLELRRLDRILGWFGVRNSEAGHPPLNLLLLWDIRCVVALERWQRDSGRRLRGWLEALGQLEALCSLAALAQDRPELSFPELLDGPAQLRASALGHPLLPPSARVDNDVTLHSPGHALLVTGSNMSGKSTLLRSIGLAAVMAFAGGPVCARTFSVAALSVHTSLRVNDSLADGVSRFYAELQRLRAMLAAAREPLPVLFLVDEILAGTNSQERGVGARWLLAELLRADAIGAISTHDAALCQLPAALMARVEQAHFREHVAEERLAFDYRLRSGPVKSGNALRLMRSLGLAVP